MKRLLSGLLTLALGFWAQPAPAVAAETASPSDAGIRAELQAPVKVTTRIGRDFTGQPIKVDADQIVLLASAGSGSVEYTFAREEIVAVHVPGVHLKAHALDLIADGATEPGLQLLDRLFALSEPFFPYLPVSEPAFFARTVPQYRIHGRLRQARQRAEQLAPILEEETETAKLLRDEILLTSYLLGDVEQARRLAESRVAEQPRSAGSAMGWHILGRLQVREGEFEDAFLTFLRPIVFSGILAGPYLEDCYAGAIETALRLGRPNSARKLEAERIARGLPWPANRPLPDFSDEISLSPDSPNPLP